MQQQIITSAAAAWLYAPTWLTPWEAAGLTGHSLDFIQWMIEDGCVETDGNGLIEKYSLRDYQETLLDVFHWPD